MQYEVHPSDQTQDMSPKLNGSFKTAYASHTKNPQKSTRNFPDVRFSRGFHRKSEFSFYTIKSDHSRLRFPSKPAQSWKTLKNGCFWPYIADYWMIQIFPGKTAVYVSRPYSKEHSCKKAKKSLARFSVTFAYRQTDGRTDGLTFPDLTSTEVENCNAVNSGLNVRPWNNSNQSR